MASTPAEAFEGEKKKMIVLRSSDGEEFEVEEVVAMESQTIASMIEDDCTDNGIPLPNVHSKILAKVMEYCKKHAAAKANKPAASNINSSNNDGGADDELKKWDAEFVQAYNQGTLFELILAANFMNIKGLLDLTCQRVADMIKGKSPEEIRTMFNIENDFTKEEEEAIREENKWAFDLEEPAAVSLTLIRVVSSINFMVLVVVRTALMLLTRK